MEESDPSVGFSKWKRRHKHKGLRSCPGTNTDIPDVLSKSNQPDSEWVRTLKPKLKPIHPLGPHQNNRISKKSKKDYPRLLSNVAFFGGISEPNEETKGWSECTEIGRHVIMNNSSMVKRGSYERGQKIPSALRVGGSSCDGSSDGSGGGSGDTSGGGSGGSPGDGSSGGPSGSSGDRSGLSITPWGDWARMVWTSADPVNEALFRSNLKAADYSRLNRKIGAIAHSACVNLCYLNAGIQALAATRFVHFVDRGDQLAPISGDGHGLLQITERIRDAFRGVNKWCDAGFGGSLATRVLAGRVHQTPVPQTIGMGMPPFLDPSTGFTPMCDMMEFLDSIIGSLNEEYFTELETFRDWGASGWVNHQNPTAGMQATKISCLICGYTYVEQNSRVWIGALHKPFAENNAHGRHAVSVPHSLDHFTRVALVESEACISCNLIDLYKINRRARRHLRANAKKEVVAGGEASKGTLPDMLEIDRRLLAIEQALRRKLTNDRIPVDENGRLRGINMRSEAVTPRSPRSETQAISRLPDTIILGFNIVQSETTKKNRTQLKIPQVLSFAPWTADMTDGNHSRDPLRPLRPKDSRFNDGIEFECRAISYHRGEDTNGGHYFTDRMPWIPNPRDVAAGKDTNQPYEWWFCNEYLTDMFPADQPFPRPSGAKEQEVLVVYERIMNPADKAAIIPASRVPRFDYNREYHFSEYPIPAGPPVVFKNEQKALDDRPLIDWSKWTKFTVTGLFSAVGTRSSKRVRVCDDEDGNLIIQSMADTRPSKRARVSEYEAGGRGVRSTGRTGPEVEKQRRKTLERLHDSNLIRNPKALADPEKKRKWRMGGSHGGHFIIPPADTSASSIESNNNEKKKKQQRARNPHERGETSESPPSGNAITPIYIVHDDDPIGYQEMGHVEKPGSNNRNLSERTKGKRPAYGYFESGSGSHTY
ncbi:uncharacterized protein DFL_004822 [Arthrobotrys flagrans]|uniref:Peptidase C19 ubiquitin carboxyl-terminal hydrolase domain-containing protein n=1 Tax=Arthrobotrys flagrans TaxID=97331 RepID=A0A437A628_ARTFL|nr:hypothetical protein DFL_004822 [Arthrobotrys flagrans]